MRLRYGTPFWLDRPGGSRGGQFPAQRGDLEVDVAIVGGGFTGCATACVFAEAGVRVAVLERARIGCGSAAASTALLMHEPDLLFIELRRRYGRARTKAIWKLSRVAVAELAALARSLDCGVRFPQSLRMATDSRGADLLKREHKAHREAGLGGRLLGPTALKRIAGLDGRAAISSRGNAVVDPYRLTHALARAAATSGARLFEHSPAARIDRSRQGVSIVTPRGTVRARSVVIATGFATPEFKPLHARFKMATTYVIATERLDNRQRARMGNGRIMFCDLERPYHYCRWTDDGRILFGGGDHPVSSESARRRRLVESAARLTQDLSDLFPDAGPIKVSHAWEGLFATTPDGLPYIGPHRHYRRHLFALGWGGNGMTFGFLAARILLRKFLGEETEGDDFFSFGRFRGGRRL